MYKYIWEGLKNTKAGLFTALQILTSILSLSINAKILYWLSKAVEDLEHATQYEWYIIIACIIQLILDCVARLGEMEIHILFTYLNERLSNKLIDADVELFQKTSPADINSTAGKLWQICKIPIIRVSQIQNVINMSVNLVALWLLVPNQIPKIVVCYALCGVIVYFVNKYWDKIDEETDNMKDQRNAHLDEISNGFMEARSFPNTLKTHRTMIHSHNVDIMKILYKRQIMSLVMDLVAEITDTASMMFIVVWSVAMLISGESVISSSVAMAAIMYAWRMIRPFNDLIIQTSEMSLIKPQLLKLNKILDYEDKVADGTIELTHFNNSIEFRDVNFSYSDSNSVLNGVSLTIKKGQSIGICGPTGGGKSTFMKLLPRFYDVCSGGIYIDGINIKNLTKESIKQHMAIVHQNIYIFNGTIRENIEYSCWPNKPTEAQLIEACKRAAIYDFIIAQPNGFDQKVGPRGLKLSGGERQRVALARLFLLNPDIIILDEATAALDNKTEEIVQQNLKYFNGKTIITIAHRLSTIQDCDEIVVIDNHTIVEKGTHEQLRSKNGIYAALLKKGT